MAHVVRGDERGPLGPGGLSVARRVNARTSAAAPPHSRAGPGSADAPHQPGVTNTTAQSTSWSGYIDSGPTFTGVSADWVVPTVQVSQASQYSSTWIGIDGDIDTNSLIQTGTAQDTTAGTTQYFAWYELIPAVAMPIGVSPGDHMQATVVQDVTGNLDHHHR